MLEIISEDTSRVILDTNNIGKIIISHNAFELAYSKASNENIEEVKIFIKIEGFHQYLVIKCLRQFEEKIMGLINLGVRGVDTTINISKECKVS